MTFADFYGKIGVNEGGPSLFPAFAPDPAPAVPIQLGRFLQEKEIEIGAKRVVRGLQGIGTHGRGRPKRRQSAEQEIEQEQIRRRAARRLGTFEESRGNRGANFQD